MWRIISGQNEQAGKWARDLFGRQDFFADGSFTSLILERDLEIQSVVLYNQYVPGASIDLSIASVPGKRWMTPSFLRATFRYPFLELGVRRVGALVASDNAESLRLTRHAGFVQEGVAREAWAPGVDIVCFGMLKSECRFLDGPQPEIWSAEIGKAKPAAAA